MKIRVNDQPHEIADGATVADLVHALGLAGQRGVAIASCDEVVPKISWNTRALNDGDSLLVIRASQGG